MCPPKYFEINYEINPWMHIDDQPSKKKAEEEWENLKKIYESLGVDVEVIESQEGCPDMVFVANAGLPANGKFILSNFTYPERKKEEKYFNDYFEDKFEIVELPKEVNFEGQGDAFFVKDKLFLGCGFRSSREAKEEIKKHIHKSIEVVQLNLINSKFYHLDTALAYLGGGNFLVVKSAFSEDSIEELKKHGNLIFLSEEDADYFSANCIVYKDKIIMNNATGELEEKLKSLGLTLVKTNASEFLKSGGAVRCLSLVC